MGRIILIELGFIEIGAVFSVELRLSLTYSIGSCICVVRIEISVRF